MFSIASEAEYQSVAVELLLELGFRSKLKLEYVALYEFNYGWIYILALEDFGNQYPLMTRSMYARDRLSVRAIHNVNGLILLCHQSEPFRTPSPTDGELNSHGDLWLWYKGAVQEALRLKLYLALTTYSTRGWNLYVKELQPPPLLFDKLWKYSNQLFPFKPSYQRSNQSIKFCILSNGDNCCPDFRPSVTTRPIHASHLHPTVHCFWDRQSRGSYQGTSGRAGKDLLPNPLYQRQHISANS